MSLNFVRKMWRSIHRGKVFGASLTDLSKAFNCLNHDLLIGKLNAHGLSLPALRLIHYFLWNRTQRTRMDNSYSTWMEIVFEVSQRSVLGPFLFNIFLSDLFFTVNSMNITDYATANDVDSLIVSLISWRVMLINAIFWSVLMKNKNRNRQSWNC